MQHQGNRLACEKDREFWQRRMKRALSAEDVRAIKFNLCGFFGLLTEWKRRAVDPEPAPQPVTPARTRTARRTTKKGGAR